MLDQSSPILITGANGFLGKYVVSTLYEKGYENLVCLSRKPIYGQKFDNSLNEPKWVYGDICDVSFLDDCLQGIECIVNCASVVTFDNRKKKRILKTAVEGTANLVNIAMENNIKYFLHISSVAALGRKKSEEVIDEKSIFKHSMYDTTYGLSKFLSEQEVWRAHAEGLNVGILNPSTILGSGNWHQSSPKIFKKIYGGLSVYPTGTTGWVDVRDVCKAVIKMLELLPDGERFVISSENISYQQVFQKIASNLGAPPPAKPLQSRYGDYKWRLEFLKSLIFSQEPLVTKETYYSTSVTAHYRNEKSIQTLGINYSTVEDVISESCKLFLDSYPKGLEGDLLSLKK